MALLMVSALVVASWIPLTTAGQEQPTSDVQSRALLESTTQLNQAAAEAEENTFTGRRADTAAQPDNCRPTSSLGTTHPRLGSLMAATVRAQEVIEVREPKVRITSLQGDVRLQPAGLAERAATADDVLCEGDELFAGFDSSAVVTSESGITVTVRSNTQLRIATLAERNFNIRLERGAVRTTVRTTGPTRPDVRIQTPTATASVRGTDFEVRYDAVANETSVGVFEGTVTVTPSNTELAPMVLTAHQETRISDTSALPAQPLSWVPEEDQPSTTASDRDVSVPIVLGILGLLIILGVVIRLRRKSSALH